MKNFFLFLISIAFGACSSTAVTEVKEVTEIVSSLREAPSEWRVDLKDDVADFTHANGVIKFLYSLKDENSVIGHGTLNLEPGGITLFPNHRELSGEALQVVRAAARPYVDSLLAQRAKAKEDAKVIKLQ